MRRRVQDSPQHVTELNHPQESLCCAIGGLLPRQLSRGHQQRPSLLHRLTPRSQGGMLCPAETQKKRTTMSRQETWPRPQLATNHKQHLHCPKFISQTEKMPSRVVLSRHHKTFICF